MTISFWHISVFEWFDDGIEISVITEQHKIFTQTGDMHASRNIHGHAQRKQTIDRLNLTDNALLNQTKQSLANLATTDTDANVRSVAIARLEELADAQHYQTTFIAALKDPSDMVVSTV